MIEEGHDNLFMKIGEVRAIDMRKRIMKIREVRNKCKMAL